MRRRREARSNQEEKDARCSGTKSNGESLIVTSECWRALKRGLTEQGGLTTSSSTGHLQRRRVAKERRRKTPALRGRARCIVLLAEASKDEGISVKRGTQGAAHTRRRWALEER